jgi:hypothetical protein
MLDRPRPRNKVAYAAAQELHAAVRAIVVELVCPHCHHAPAAKSVNKRLAPHLQRNDRTINNHVRQVMAEIGERQGNLSGD